MDFFTQHKTTVIGIVVIVGAFLVYFFFFRGPADDAALLSSEATSGVNTELSTEFVNLLAELQSITLDASFFARPEFRALTDLTKPLTPEFSGRANPFRPIGQ
jgi:hypothetical protein